MDVTPGLSLDLSYKNYCLAPQYAILVGVCCQGLLCVCITTDRIDVSHDAKLVGACKITPVHHLCQARYAVHENKPQVGHWALL